jgi:hypothetical protein
VSVAVRVKAGVPRIVGATSFDECRVCAGLLVVNSWEVSTASFVPEMFSTGVSRTVVRCPPAASLWLWEPACSAFVAVMGLTCIVRTDRPG